MDPSILADYCPPPKNYCFFRKSTVLPLPRITKVDFEILSYRAIFWLFSTFNIYKCGIYKSVFTILYWQKLIWTKIWQNFVFKGHPEFAFWRISNLKNLNIHSLFQKSIEKYFLWEILHPFKINLITQHAVLRAFRNYFRRINNFHFSSS